MSLDNEEQIPSVNVLSIRMELLHFYNYLSNVTLRIIYRMSRTNRISTMGLTATITMNICHFLSRLIENKDVRIPVQYM